MQRAITVILASLLVSRPCVRWSARTLKYPFPLAVSSDSGHEHATAWASSSVPPAFPMQPSSSAAPKCPAVTQPQSVCHSTTTLSPPTPPRHCALSAWEWVSSKLGAYDISLSLFFSFFFSFFFLGGGGGGGGSFFYPPLAWTAAFSSASLVTPESVLNYFPNERCLIEMEKCCKPPTDLFFFFLHFRLLIQQFQHHGCIFRRNHAFAPDADRQDDVRVNCRASNVLHVFTRNHRRGR